VSGVEPESITLRINGRKQRVAAGPTTSLLSILRGQLNLTGAKEACGQGECGACTVLLDGKAVYSCLLFALQAQGREITTVEGLSTDGSLHPVQQAFIDEDALQCGFCIPGQVVSAVALLRENPAPTLADIKEALTGNICRCCAYPHIFNAVQTAAARLREPKHNA